MTYTVRTSRLYREELRGLPRARFALPGIALFAAALIALAVVVIPSPLGLWSFALLVYGTGPVLIGAFAALQMASLRATRLTQSLFTLPVQSRAVVDAHLLVSLTLAALYLIATVPFLIVTGLHVPVAASVLRLLVGGGALMVFAAVLGTLMGVLFTGRSVAAPVALTTGFLFLAMLAITPNASLQLSGMHEGSAVMRLLHLSPYVLVSDALGLLTPSVGAAAASPMRALALVAFQVLALFALTRWVFVREQGPEGWESTEVRKGAVLGALALVLLATPLALADDAYVSAEADPTERYGSSSMSRNATITLVRPGAAPDAAGFGDGRAGTYDDPLAADQANRRDLLIRLIEPDAASVQNVRITLESGPYLTVSPQNVHLRGTGAADAYAGEALVRVPVVLTPTEPIDLSSNVYQLWVNVTYETNGDGDGGVHEAQALAALEAHVPWALVQLTAAGSPLFLAATSWAIVRRLQVG